MIIVWFKRDFRLDDHEPLFEALKTNSPVLCLHIIEPKLWDQPDMSLRQFKFYLESLKELNQECENKGFNICTRIGDAKKIMNQLHEELDVKKIFSHQETWNDWTYKRDLEIKKWCQQKDVKWIEYAQFNVIRKLTNRDGWSKKWNIQMNQPVIKNKSFFRIITKPSDEISEFKNFNLKSDGCQYRQAGGRKNGMLLLNSFFNSRGCFYTKEMSSPVTAPQACSRLSPYIAFGCISMKEIYQFAKQFQGKDSFIDREYPKSWKQATRSFTGRLRWHCHFIQKLEDQPSLEFNHIHSAYNNIEYNHPDTNESFEKWKKGQTGFPLVDACMRALDNWGWLNFRMRAMVMSFAAHHLFLHWRDPAIYLASQFVDYEPGIHYSQCQMQAGTTGINTIRIYNPIKQGRDNDPNGAFIKEWVPELRNCPEKIIHTPWEWQSIENKYPNPIVDESNARKHAASKLYSLRRSGSFQGEAKIIVKKHASRRNLKVKKNNGLQSVQLSLLNIENKSNYEKK